MKRKSYHCKNCRKQIKNKAIEGCCCEECHELHTDPIVPFLESEYYGMPREQFIEELMQEYRAIRSQTEKKGLYERIETKENLLWRKEKKPS